MYYTPQVDCNHDGEIVRVDDDYLCLNCGEVRYVSR